jgi:hypothetical protein
VCLSEWLLHNPSTHCVVERVFFKFPVELFDPKILFLYGILCLKCRFQETTWPLLHFLFCYCVSFPTIILSYARPAYQATVWTSDSYFVWFYFPQNFIYPFRNYGNGCLILGLIYVRVCLFNTVFWVATFCTQLKRVKTNYRNISCCCAGWSKSLCAPDDYNSEYNCLTTWLNLTAWQPTARARGKLYSH